MTVSVTFTAASILSATINKTVFLSQPETVAMIYRWADDLDGVGLRKEAHAVRCVAHNLSILEEK